MTATGIAHKQAPYRQRRQRPEEMLHRAVADYLDKAIPADAFWWANTAQRGTRKRFEMGVLNALGQKAGLPDVMIIWRGALYGIELKSETGRLTATQTAVLGRLQAAGAFTAVCRSLEAVEAQLGKWSIPLRARVAA